MNMSITSVLLASACAAGIGGAAMAQDMSQTAPQQPQTQPQTMQQPVTQQPAMQQPAQSAPMQSAASAGGAQSLPVDQETTVSGVTVMCGGIGSDESDPRYANYPAKIEVAGGYG